jgi:hypothetical protein
VNRAEGLRKLGLKSTKTLPDKLLANDDIPLLTEESEE